MLALGTHNGGVHILDFSGHEVRARCAETGRGGDRGTLEGGVMGVAEKLLTLTGCAYVGGVWCMPSEVFAILNRGKLEA
jgi:hypothetical protein